MQDIGFTVESKNLSFTHPVKRAFFEPLWEQELVFCAVMDSRIQVKDKYDYTSRGNDIISRR